MDKINFSAFKMSLKLITILIPIVVLSSWYRTYNNNHKEPESIQLFNGQNLKGWYTYIKGRGRNRDPQNVFHVDNGLIHITGQEFGCLTTKKEYENYKLIIEYQWGGMTYPPRENKARDSGILINSIGKDGAALDSWMYSIEIQLIEGGTGDIIVVSGGLPNFYISSFASPIKHGNIPVFDPKGESIMIQRGRLNWHGRDPLWKDIKGYRGINDVEKQLGEWNELIISNGEALSVFLNGILVNKAVDFKPRKGRIQIQSEGAEIYFKRIELIPI